MSQRVLFKMVSVSPAIAGAPPLRRAAAASSDPDAALRKSDILIEATDASRPPSLRLHSLPGTGGWAVVANARSTFEKEMRDAGWILFFTAGKIKASALGFDPAEALRNALTELGRKAKARHCNALEIIRIRRLRFLGISRVSVSVRVRHLQKGSVFFGQ